VLELLAGILLLWLLARLLVQAAGVALGCAVMMLIVVAAVAMRLGQRTAGQLQLIWSE
jgi:hypothetical protein